MTKPKLSSRQRPAQKPAKQLGNAHAEDVLWTVYVEDRPTERVHVKARTWFSARADGALKLRALPSECAGHLLSSDASVKVAPGPAVAASGAAVKTAGKALNGAAKPKP